MQCKTGWLPNYRAHCCSITAPPELHVVVDVQCQHCARVGRPWARKGGSHPALLTARTLTGSLQRYEAGREMTKEVKEKVKEIQQAANEAAPPCRILKA